MSQYFKPHEYNCRCDRGSKCDAVPMKLKILMALDGMRRERGKAIRLESGCRCRYWNEKEGGSDNSDHLYGEAADVDANTPLERGEIMVLAIRHGFNRIGIPRSGKGFIHLAMVDRLKPGQIEVFGY